MSAAPRLCEAYNERPSALEALLAHAESLRLAGRIGEAESVLTEAITIVPERPDAYRALALLQARDGRDLDAFSTCATMLARGGHDDAATLALAADILLFLHIRHASLLTRQTEPARLDLQALGLLHVAPMLLAPEFLTRARALAQAAVERAPRDTAAHATLAECELRAGYASAARRAAEHAVACAPVASALMVRALASYADHREGSALDHLQSPPLTEFAPSLGMGHLVSARIDGSYAPADFAHDPGRLAWTIPYSVHHDGRLFERSVRVQVGPSQARTIRGGRVVGDHFFPLDPTDRAYIHGVIEDPDVQFATPRCHDMPAVLARSRNTVLWGGTDRRLLLHTPTVERERSGRAFLLASNYSASYYHWTLDALGRLSACPEVLADPEMLFVVPTPMLSFQVESLAWLGITLDRVVQVAHDEIVGFDELVVVHHRKDGNCSDAGVIRWLRDHLTIPQLVPPPPPSGRLYVRRGGSALTNRVLNEADVERVFRDFGYAVVETASMTVAAQRDLFSTAARVAGPIGTGLTNLLFAPSGTQTLLLGQRGFVSPSYSALAVALGHRVRYVLGAEKQSPFIYPHWDVVIDLQELRTALEQGEGD